MQMERCIGTGNRSGGEGAEEMECIRWMKITRSIELVWNILRFFSELNEAIGQTAHSSARLPVSLENLAAKSLDINMFLRDRHQEASLFTDPRVEQAMLAVDRGDFTPSHPYEDSPQGIGYGATISAPHMHAAALEYLKNHLVEGAYALDVGSGSGYLAVCMAKMVGRTGKVVGVDHIPQLVELSIDNTRKHHADMLDSGRLVLVEGDGRLGYKADRQYNAIHVGAAAEKIPDAVRRSIIRF
ncbi:hypothetical protein WR25_17254 [Diploscapter pachys]|uniref:protein-L-isoaspartate(D-aspartate) O-methyltransferase n=1 Tax=Diploscapter pachys TaxID=2018661 RepID=A0A2A2LR88_9BILA|nr:hypothetical protein WR25_17254 [Diploscapter pachys]